ATKCRVMAIDGFNRIMRRLKTGEVAVSNRRITAMVFGNSYLNRVGGNSVNVALKQLGNAFWILVGNQTYAYFGTGFSRKYGFFTFFLITAPEAIDIERRTG